MTLDSDDVDAEVLHRVLDGLRRMPDQRRGHDGPDGSDGDGAPPRPEGDDGGDGVLPRRRHP